MTDKKNLLEYQKQRLELEIDEISTPIFSIGVRNIVDDQRFNGLNGVCSAKIQPQKKETVLQL